MPSSSGTPTLYQRFVRGVFAVDLLVGIALALPVPHVADLVIQAHTFSGVSGSLVPLTDMGLLMMHLAGLFLALWSASQLLQPSWKLARLDMGARMFLVALFAASILTQGLSALLWGVVAGEGFVVLGHLVLGRQGPTDS